MNVSLTLFFHLYHSILLMTDHRNNVVNSFIYSQQLFHSNVVNYAPGKCDIAVHSNFAF